MKKMICVTIEPELLEELDKCIYDKPYFIKRNRAIENAIRNYINASRQLQFGD